MFGWLGYFGGWIGLCFSLVVLVLLFVLFELWYQGYFTKMKVRNRMTGGGYIAGMTYFGPYKNAHKTTMKVHNSLVRVGVISNDDRKHSCFGVYFDNPEDTKPEKCRSFNGCVLNDDQFEELTSYLGDKNSDDDKLNNLFVIEFPRKMQPTIIAPMRSHLYIVGLLIAIYKAYATFKKYFEGRCEEETFYYMEKYSEKKTDFIAMNKVEDGHWKDILESIEKDMNEL